MRRFILPFCALGILASITGLGAVRAEDVKVTIPERTEIKVVLKQSLKSGGVKENTEVPFEVKQDVVEPGTGVVLIKAGTPAFGTVLKSQKRGMFGKPGKLDFSCEYVLMPDLSRVPLRSKIESVYGRDNRGASVATAVFLAPIAIFIKGRDVTANKGQEYTFFVDKTTMAGTKPLVAGAAPTSPTSPTSPAAPAPVEIATPAASASTAAAPAAVPTAPAAPAVPAITGSQWAFLTKDGTAVIGSLLSFVGTSFNVNTAEGAVTLKLAEVKSVVPAKSTAAGADKFLFFLKDESNVVGVLVRFNGEAFQVMSDAGEKSIKAKDLESISKIRS